MAADNYAVAVDVANMALSDAQAQNVAAEVAAGTPESIARCRASHAE